MDIHRNIRRESRAVKNRLLSKIFDSSTTSATLLHGMLHIKIISCSKLRNFDRVGNVSSFFYELVILSVIYARIYVSF